MVDSGIQLTIGVLLMALIISAIIYYIFPAGSSEVPKFPNFNLPGIGTPGLPGFPSGPGSGATGPTGPDMDPSPSPSPSGCATGPVAPSNCQMRCQSDLECPNGLGCVDGICRCRSTLGGMCRQTSDCDCRLGIKCSSPEQKCVPNNFYFDFGEASENCPTGVRRGYFYDPYIYMSDGTRGDFQEGYRCV